MPVFSISGRNPMTRLAQPVIDLQLTNEVAPRQLYCGSVIGNWLVLIECAITPVVMVNSIADTFKACDGGLRWVTINEIIDCGWESNEHKINFHGSHAGHEDTIVLQVN